MAVGGRSEIGSASRRRDVSGGRETTTEFELLDTNSDGKMEGWGQGIKMKKTKDIERAAGQLKRSEQEKRRICKGRKGYPITDVIRRRWDLILVGDMVKIDDGPIGPHFAPPLENPLIEMQRSIAHSMTGHVSRTGSPFFFLFISPSFPFYIHVFRLLYFKFISFPFSTVWKNRNSDVRVAPAVAAARNDFFFFFF